MGVAIDMSGKKYNRLTCIEKLEERQKGHIMWRFKCDCGKVITARGGDVRQGKTVSCGCRTIEIGKNNKGKSNEERRKKALRK